MKRKSWKITLVDLVKKIIFETNKTHVYAYAAQASFFVIISTFPFTMLLFTIIQTVVPISEYEVLKAASNLLPNEIANVINQIIQELYTKTSVSITLLSSLVLLWSASRGVKSIASGLKMVYHNKQTVGYIKSSLFSLIYTLVFMLSIILSVVLLLFGQNFANILATNFPPISYIVSVFMSIRSIISLVFLTLVFMVAYKFLASNKTKFKSHFPGAFLAASGWIVFSYGFSIYIKNFSNYSYIYGSLAAIILLMLWLYFCMIILLIGAQTNMWLIKKDIKLKIPFFSKTIRLRKKLKDFKIFLLYFK